ncbi:hypothetical protein OG897_17160 [Streptomyces sp. NBC_00237]|uniref:hypothetical protein n=1 Tax=Streptomyces sp. NBC_00237 TaxID=2975687 RepID=UPI002253E4B2|nr:hypothetical protein [Streptomyces sp. NBC_00237]MCX5203170.1 hypothetical protein [Streptomyces sp. NBC_00237]
MRTPFHDPRRQRIALACGLVPLAVVLLHTQLPAPVTVITLVILGATGLTLVGRAARPRRRTQPPGPGTPHPSTDPAAFMRDHHINY